MGKEDTSQDKATEVQESDSPAFDALPNKHKRFVLAYVQNRFNATKAAQVIGLSSPQTTGPRLARSAQVRAAIEEHLSAFRMSAGEVLAELRKLAFCSVEDFVSVRVHKGREVLTLDLKKAQKLGELGAIREFKTDGAGNLVSLKLHDRVRTLDMIARAIGLLSNGNGDQDEYGGEQEKAVAYVPEKGQVSQEEISNQAASLEEV